MGNSWRKLQQDKEEEDVSSSFTCEICIEPFSLNEKFKNKPNCTHPFCMACGRRQRRRRQMPGLTCDHLLDPLACRPILPASLFVKWCDLLVEQKVVVGFERFYCPNQECSALIVNECGGVETKKKSTQNKFYKIRTSKRTLIFNCKLKESIHHGKLITENSQKHQEDEEEDDDSTLACEICIESISSNKKFKNNHNCTHSFCMDCMASYIQVKVEDQYVPDVACPALDCGHLLDPLHYLPILPAKLFTKWSDLLCEKVVLLGFERCYCPNQTCSVLIVNECGGNVRRSKCPNCKKLFCFQCKSPWHSDYRCDERKR
ncbi:hypothetical protein AAG906_022401 [Vitis piasezkii]